MERRCPSAACYETIHLIDGYDSVLNLVPPSLGRVALPKAAFRTKNLSQVGTLMTHINFPKFALLLYPVETDMTSFGFQLSTSIELGYSVRANNTNRTLRKLFGQNQKRVSQTTRPAYVPLK